MKYFYSILFLLSFVVSGMFQHTFAQDQTFQLKDAAASLTSVNPVSFAVQGVLRDPSGRSVDDATYTITFALYNVATGGASLWSETQNNVQVTHGVFAVKLGTVSSLSSLTFAETYYLGITVQGSTEFTPRIELMRSPYAVALIGATNIIPSNGNIGIGTLTPTHRFTIDGDFKMLGAGHGIYFSDGSFLSSASNSSAGNLSNDNTASVIYNADESGADDFLIKNGLSEIARFSSTNRLGLGITTPLGKLHIDPVNEPAILSNAGSTEGDFTVLDGQILQMGHWNSSTSTFTQRMSVETDGTVQVEGQVKIKGGTPANGEVLVSDANGLASWQKAGVPIGVITMWSGAIGSIPSGWALCDGTNGTPDLRGRFIAGYNSADADYNAIGDIGGAETVTLTTAQIPSHTHTGTTNTDGSHTHSTSFATTGYTASYNGSSEALSDDINNGTTSRTTNSTGSHDHSFTTNATGGGGSHENRPPFYTLAFIMHISN